MINFWNIHSIWFIIFMFFFPRLTILFSSVAFGGIFFWLGFIFTPRLLVAILATKYYVETNPFLVFFTWIWALFGENFEKTKIVKFSKKRSNLEQKHRDNIIDI